MRRFALFALVAALACGCQNPDRRPNVILLSVDTLRADRLGVYGETRPISPVIDGLGRGGAVFENAYAVAPWTLPSHMSMLTGLYPRSHGARTPEKGAAHGIPHLAGILREAGYQTQAFTEGGYAGAGYGLERGFDSFEGSRERGVSVFDRALTAIDARDSGRPFFLFLQTFDVHCPYLSGPGARKLLQQPDEPPISVRHLCFHGATDADLDESERAYFSKEYDGGIFRFNFALGSFVRSLRGRGAYGNTFFILTSDHGEEFFEHGRHGHGANLHAESTRVPLVFRGPGIAPRRIATPVSLVDLTPTVLDLLGLPADERTEGKSLRALLEHGQEEDGMGSRPLFMSTDLGDWERRAVVHEGLHLIQDRRSGRLELYDLTQDPAEANRLNIEGRAEVPTLLGLLEEHFDEEAQVSSPDGVPVSWPRRRRLRELGYLDSGGS